MNGFFWLVFAFYLTVTHQTSLPDEQQAKMLEYNKKCLGSSNLDPAVLKKIHVGEFPEDAKLEEYFGCMFQAIGFLNESGEFQVEVAKSKMPSGVKPEDGAKVIQACKDKKGDTVGKTAYMIYQCYYQVSPTHIVFGF